MNEHNVTLGSVPLVLIRNEGEQKCERLSLKVGTADLPNCQGHLLPSNLVLRPKGNHVSGR